MNKNILICIGITILFLGLAIQPSVATVQPRIEKEIQTEEKIIDIEPKNYLFQTIIDIANNPEVKNLLEQHHNELFNVNIDRSVYRKLLLRNPRLFSSLLFTKPSMTHEYLDKCYNKGIEIVKILGEDKALELIESIEVSDTEVFDELNNIIFKDEKLSDKLSTLKEMNNELNSDMGYPIICYLLFIPALAFAFIWAFLIMIYVILNYYLPIISEIFFYVTVPFDVIMFIFVVFLVAFGCVSPY